MDLGASYPADERYRYAYKGGSTGIGDLYPEGTIKFIRTFKPPANITVAGPDKDIAGIILYEYVESGKTKYMGTYFWSPHLPPTVLPGANGASSHPPAACMGQANGYELGQIPNHLDDGIVIIDLQSAIAKMAHPGNGVKGSGGGGMTDYISNMTIFYCYNPDYP
jgi:hypothetical protein